MKITKTQLKKIIKEELGRVLSEGKVVAHGLTVWTENYSEVDVTLDGEPIAIPAIFDQLNNMGEYKGWKNNVPEEGWEDFYTVRLEHAIESWADMSGHAYEAPDYN